jgi:hypothetical protein
MDIPALSGPHWRAVAYWIPQMTAELLRKLFAEGRWRRESLSH